MVGGQHALVHHELGDVAQLAVGVAGVATQHLERRLQGHVVALHDDALRRPDHVPALHGGPQSRDQPGGDERGRGVGGEDLRPFDADGIEGERLRGVQVEGPQGVRLGGQRDAEARPDAGSRDACGPPGPPGVVAHVIDQLGLVRLDGRKAGALAQLVLPGVERVGQRRARGDQLHPSPAAAQEDPAPVAGRDRVDRALDDSGKSGALLGFLEQLPTHQRKIGCRIRPVVHGQIPLRRARPRPALSRPLRTAGS